MVRNTLANYSRYKSKVKIVDIDDFLEAVHDDNIPLDIQSIHKENIENMQCQIACLSKIQRKIIIENQ